jgi:hypothetical protein
VKAKLVIAMSVALGVAGWHLMTAPPLRAAGGPIAVPGTADVDRASAPKPLERQIVEAEMAKSPPFKDLTRMSGRDATGDMVRPISTSVHIENGSPVWYVGTVGKCGGELPPPDLEADVRAEFAKYTTTPVKFEKGAYFSTSPMNFHNCK